MQIALTNERGEQELDVQVRRPDAVVSDLAAALGTAEVLYVDGRSAHPDEVLTEVGVGSGSRVRVGSPAAETPVTGPRAVVVGGVDAGRVLPLRVGANIVGRSIECDIHLAGNGVSRRHCEIRVDDGAITVTDLGSSVGTLVAGAAIAALLAVGPDDLVEVGDNLLLLSSGEDLDDYPKGLDPVRDMTAAGVVPFNRPPRRTRVELERTIRVPDAPKDAQSPPFNLAMILAPLGVAGVMAAVTKQPLYALMALASPVMAGANAYESRHRNKRSLRRDTRQYEDDLAEMKCELVRLGAAERALQRERSPHLAEVARRAATPSDRLWERRPNHDDFLMVSTGYADMAWQPPVDTGHREVSRESAEAIAAASTLRGAPVTVALGPRDALGIVGDRSAALAAVRALVCQAAVHQGPADLSVALLTRADRSGDWDWVKWLPHTRDARGRNDQRLIATGGRPESELADDTREVLDALATRFSLPTDKSGASEVALVVVDDLDLFTGRDAPGRSLLKDGERMTAIVIAPTRDRLPALCGTVLELADDSGTATLTRPRLGDEVGDFLISGFSEKSARTCARDLARFEDPDLEVPGGSIPDECPLLPLLGLDETGAQAVTARWAKHPPGCALPTPIGLGPDGPLPLDVVRNGPHALIGGTTGSGKSELLRSLVVGLAALAPPESLVFILLDFKGGATFVDFTDVPHIVGAASDLDEHLAQRALRCLNAELVRRKEQLEARGIRDVKEQLDQPAASGQRPMPRLVVVIDEFGEMAERMPDFLDSLDSIARQGRTLGVHLILATQKPAGVVSPYVASNVDLKIALRVQEPGDSREVVGAPDAAYILKSQPGRAIFRFGASQLVPVQTAYGGSPMSRSESEAIELGQFVLGRNSRSALRARPVAEGPSEIDHLLSLIRAASAGHLAPEPVWLDPLPETVPIADVALAAPPAVVFGVIDDPDHQRRLPLTWDLDGGNLLVYGIVGSGKSVLLQSVAASLALSAPPDQMHLFGLDFGNGQLTGLEELAHTGAVVQAADSERQERLVAYLDSELARRRQLSPAARGAVPRLVLLVDNFAALVAATADQPMGDGLLDRLGRLFADGPGARIHTVMTTDRVGSVPMAWASVTQQRLALRLAEPLDFTSLGLPARSLPKPSELPPGRGFAVVNALEFQVATAPPVPALAEQVAAAWPGQGRSAARVASLPSTLTVDDLVGSGGKADCRTSPWQIPVGLTDATLHPAVLPVFEGEHILVAGPPRSGRSSCLALIGRQLLAGEAAPRVMAVAVRPSPVRDCAGIEVAVDLDAAGALLDEAAARAVAEPLVVLLDDADLLTDLDAKIATLVTSRVPTCHVAFVARNDSLRSLFGHWTQDARKSRLGVLLRPDVDLDGSLLSAQLPRRQRRAERPGLGYVVINGSPTLVQFAYPGALAAGSA